MTKTFLLSGKLGDIIASLASVKSYCRTVYKAIYYIDLKKGMTVDEYGMLKTLLVHQSYIDDVRIWDNEEIDFNFDDFSELPIRPQGNIARWFSYLYPELQCDLSNKWIDVTYFDPYIKKMIGNGIVVSLSERYRNELVNYSFLNTLNIPIHFLGTEQEAEKFYDIVPTARWMKVNDFLETAYCIQCSRFLITNQNFHFWLAEAMGHPRILEVYPPAPNCVIHTKEGDDFINQKGLEYFVNQALC